MADTTHVVHVNGVEVVVWVGLLCCALGCIGQGADAAADRNVVAVVWWALILLLALGVLAVYSALVVSVGA